MDSKIVNKSIKKIIVPFLKEQGFTVFTSRNAWRDSGNKIDVINFQSFNSYHAMVHECTTFSFAVNLGIYYKCIPELYSEPKIKLGILCPDEVQCHFRKSLIGNLKQNERTLTGIWYIEPDGSNVEMALQDVKDKLNDEGLHWFGKYSEMNEALRAILENGQDIYYMRHRSKGLSPEENYHGGYIALALGNYELAKNLLHDAIKSDCFKIEQLKTDYEALVAKYGV